jgi:hypothetical protein
MRAMREARYREMSARSSTASRPSRPAVRPAQTQAADPDDPASPTELLCGHRSMNGRTCTREQGHAAKSHRYS